VVAYERLKLSDNLAMAAERQLGLDQLLERGDLQVIETGDLALREWLIGQLLQRRTAPQRQRPLERQDGPLRMTAGQLTPPFGRQPLEAVRVEALGIEPQLVAAPARHHQPGGALAGLPPECLAQAGDLHLHRLGGVRGWALAPELVDQPVGAERLVGVQQ
jgi:hypothetical protein